VRNIQETVFRLLYFKADSGLSSSVRWSEQLPLS